MIIGIGIDIVEIGRIKKMMEKQSKFVQRILTDREQDVLQALTGDRKAEYLAGRFAAKEAYAKAVGTGIGKDLSFRDIEIQKDERGKPFIVKPKQTGVHLSISHSEEYAVAQVVLES